MLDALSERPVRLIVGAQALSLVGSGAAPVALTFGILDHHGGAGAVGAVGAAGGISFALLLLPAGVVADRLPRRRVAAAADLGRAAAMAGTTAVLAFVHGGVVVPLFLLGLLWGGSRAFFTPTLTGLIPELVPQDRLREANSLRNIAVSAGLAVGPALGGVVIAVAGPAAGALVALCGYLGSVSLLYRLPPVPPPPRSDTHPLTDLAVGLREVRSRPWCWSTIVSAAALHLLALGPMFVFGPIVAKESLGGAAPWGAIAAAEGIGGVVGAMWAGHLHLRRALPTALVLSVAGAPVFVTLALRLPLGYELPASALLGLIFGIFGVIWETELQTRIPRAALSRVSSVDWLGSTATYPLGQGLAGLEAGLIGVSGGLYLGAVAMVLFGVSPLLLPEVRHLETATTREDAGGALIPGGVLAPAATADLAASAASGTPAVGEVAPRPPLAQD